ncbi:MAG TPA: hypothetical protein VNM48_10835 [Chloroflexota bacterium]|nr:hypothetical protein [Chloroflexota bacterium]
MSQYDPTDTTTQTRVLRDTSDADTRPLCSVPNCVEWSHHAPHGAELCDSHHALYVAIRDGALRVSRERDAAIAAGAAA